MNENNNGKYEIVRELSISVSSEGIAIHILSTAKDENFDFLTRESDKIISKYISKGVKRADGVEVR